MKAGYTVEHYFSDDYLGKNGINTAHIINDKYNNKVYISYFRKFYKPNINTNNTVAIFKIKPKTK